MGPPKPGSTAAAQQSCAGAQMELPQHSPPASKGGAVASKDGAAASKGGAA
jgi:hypothetical protein